VSSHLPFQVVSEDVFVVHNNAPFFLNNTPFKQKNQAKSKKSCAFGIDK
jgi:hypothetical protein